MYFDRRYHVWRKFYGKQILVPWNPLFFRGQHACPPHETESFAEITTELLCWKIILFYPPLIVFQVAGILPSL